MERSTNLHYIPKEVLQFFCNHLRLSDRHITLFSYQKTMPSDLLLSNIQKLYHDATNTVMMSGIEDKN